MISRKLVCQIEDQSDHLAREVVEAVRRDPRTAAYLGLQNDELRRSVDEVLAQLGKWLTSRSNSAIENRYRKIGMQRRHAGIPQSQLVCALHTVQETVLQFVQGSVLASPEEIGLEADLMIAIALFFDSAVYGVALGYEAAEPAAKAAAVGATYTPPTVQAVEDADWDPTSRAGDVGEVSG
ncbi:MAG: hypothetical protein H6509_10360 [Bryobacterales bacterium]|nr:hypothetical protein [Acidobacteriota bacterium]MCB9385011.1 hypothetical protein [Bryobacterales bacterium]